MENFDQLLEKYAELGVKIGVNIQEGQDLLIRASLSAADFVRKITKVAYETGAKNVIVEWNDDEVTKIRYHHAPEESFDEFPLWKAQGFEQMAENGTAFLSIVSQDPDLLKGVDPERIKRANIAQGKALEKWRESILSDKVSWTVLATPSVAWAKKVFPEGTTEEQVEKLWEAIFKATRVDQMDPLAAWNEHNLNLQNKVEYLNAKKYKKLHYKAKGTDLTIELPAKHLWVGGGGDNQAGVNFMANMPTEEVFTLPTKDGINGYVTSSKPLSYGGNLIDNFTLTFENGKIVDYKAETGYETLKGLIETDEGSHFLGEVALVPYDSPISNLNIIFYNTLFDENASCHLAIGNAYASCLEGGTTMSKEELVENGANQSITHVDFMIGSADLDIDGETEDGQLETVFRNGNWAF